jgi:hypothetical protein
MVGTLVLLSRCGRSPLRSIGDGDQAPLTPDLDALLEFPTQKSHRYDDAEHQARLFDSGFRRSNLIIGLVEARSIEWESGREAR